MTLNPARILALLLLPLLLSSTMLSQDSQDAEMHFSQGDAYLQSKQYDEAIKEFHQAVRMKSKWPEAYFKLGLAYSATPVANRNASENYRAALEAFKEAVRLKPDWPEALMELGSKYSTFQQPDNAIKSLIAAIALDPELAEAHRLLASVYLKIGHYREAVDRLQEAIRLRPGQPLPHKMLGLAYLALDDKDKALEQYKILEPLDSEMAEYLNNAIQSPDKPTFGVTPGKLISVPTPDYPPAAKANRIAGHVTVEVAIDEQGTVTSAQAIKGPLELQGAAEAAALKARYSPTKIAGTAVKTKGVITFKFVPQ